METYETLEKALALIEREENWCQGTYKQGEALCAEGACVWVTGGRFTPRETPGRFYADHPEGSDEDAYLDAFDALNLTLENDFIHNFNDTHSHAEVVALFQRTIQSEKAKAGVLIETPEREKTCV